MNEINVFFIMRPPKYKSFISEGRYPYMKTKDGLPAMRSAWNVPVWKGAFFSKKERVFNFAEDVIKIAPIPPETAKWAQSPGTRARHIPGVIGLVGLAGDLLRSAGTDSSGKAGFIFYYSSDDGYAGLCMATAPLDCVEEILASIPPDRIDPSIAPK
jgi:hypothetical protein